MRLRALSIIILSAAVFCLSGCLKIEIDTGIDNRLNAYLSYTIQMDLSDADPSHHEILIGALNNFGWYYQEENGFTVGLTDEQDTHTLTMKKSIPNDSLPEAFASLESLLTNESVTAFTQVDMNIESYPRQESYIIDTVLDIPQIIRLSSTAGLTPELLAGFNDAIENSSGTASLTVPVTEVIESSHDINRDYNLAVMAADIDFDGQTRLMLRADVFYTADGIQIPSYEQYTENLENTRRTATIILVSALSLLLIFLLIAYVRYRIRLRDYV